MTGGVKTCFTENSVDNCAMISSPGAGLLASVNYNTDQLVFSIGRAAWCLVQRPAAPWRLNQSHLCSRGLTPYTGFLRPLTTELWKGSSVKGVPALREGDGNSGALKLYLSSIAIAAKNMFSCPLLLSASNGLRSGRRRRIHCLSFCFSPD